MTATETLPGSPGETDASQQLWRRAGATLGPPLLALVAAWAMIVSRSPYHGARLFDPSSFARWDSGHYLNIANNGYTAFWHCGRSHLPANLPPGNYLCGTIGWFPGYPFASRGFSALTSLSVPTAALAVGWLCWYLALIVMWRLLADARSAWTRWMCLLIAAFFAGHVYFAALFPISMCIAGILVCLYLALRTSRPALAWAGFGAGFVAAYSYLTAIVLAPALIITGLIARRGRERSQAIIPGLGAAAGFGAVLLTMQVAVGIWNAYFISAKKYNVGAHMPLDTLIARLRPLWTSVPTTQRHLTVSAWQTLMTMCLVFVILVVAVVSLVQGRHDLPSDAAGLTAIERRISAFDLTFVLMTVGVWLVPYIAGGSASTYRSEAFVVVCVPLLRKLPAWLLVVPLAAAVFVAWNMAPYFFNAQLR